AARNNIRSAFATRRAWATRAPLTLLALAISVGPAVSAEQANPARLHVHRTGEESFFAVQLQAEGFERVAAARDHVVLVDTSASQIGEHRRHMLAVLDAFLASLPSTDRVTLFAIDVRPVKLTPQAAGVGSPELADAVAQLRRRTPLGATDLIAALRAAGSAID